MPSVEIGILRAKQEQSLTMTVLMTPDMANFSGNVDGGSLLKLLDQVAYACAAKYCKTYGVTAAPDKVFAGDLKTDPKKHTTSCYFTMVAMDEQGQIVEVSRLQLDNEVEKRLYEAAKMRKPMRQESLEKNRALHVDLLKDEL